MFNPEGICGGLIVGIPFWFGVYWIARGIVVAGDWLWALI